VRERALARSGAERVRMGSRMLDVARALLFDSFPSGLSELEIKHRVCERPYGNEADVQALVEHLRILDD
jgi:hypothetical protein